MPQWEDAPDGDQPQYAMLMNDASLQASHPDWPTGGTSRQFGQESNFNPNAVSPKGAMGYPQVMPDTLKAVEQQMGRKLDPHNFNDSLAIQNYVMKQNMDRFGTAQAGLAAYNSGWDQSKWNNPETNAYVPKVMGPPSSAATSQAQPAWEDAPDAKQPKWEDAPDHKQPDNGLLANIKGLGIQAANLGVGALEAIPAGGVAAYNAIKNGSLSSGVKAGTDFFNNYSAEKGLNALGVDTSAAENTTAGKVVNNSMDYLFNTLPNQIGEGASRSALSELGENQSEYTPQMGQQAGDVLRMGMLTSPLAEVPHLGGALRGKFGAADAAAELDKLNKTEPSMRNDTAAGDFFPDDQFQGPATPQGFESPLDVEEGAYSRFGSEVADRRQGRFDFENDLDETSSGPMAVDNQGNAGTPEQVAEAQPYRDATAQRVAELNQRTPEQMDLFSEANNADHPYDNRALDESARPLERDEFEQTAQNLADSGKYDIPSPDDPAHGPFMDAVYDHYLDTVSDQQGGLFDRATIADNFAKAVMQDSIDRRVADHPTVKANAAKLADLQAQKDAGVGRSAGGVLDYQIQKAQDLLDKSRENIGSQYKEAAKAIRPETKDGVTYLHTFNFGVPTMMKLLAGVLKNLHGMVFRTLDKKLGNIKNLDSNGKIMAQGLRDAINREANRQWNQTQNAAPKATLKGVAGLKEAVKEFDPFGEGQQLPYEDIKQQAIDAPDTDVGAVAKNVLQGGLMLTNYTRNPIVKFVTEGVDRAVRNSNQWVRDNLIGKDGLRTKMQALSKNELTGIRSLMELNEGKREFSESELRSQGFIQKQIDYYKQSRALVKQMFDKFNQARIAAGLKPVDQRIGYIAGYFMGDFKRVITDGEGKVRAVIGHNTRSGVETLTKRFLENHPDKTLQAGDIKLNKLAEDKYGNSDPFTGYMETLNHLAGTNADVARLMDTYREYQTMNAQAAMKNRAKFKSNDAVLGAEGRKSWQSAQKNALDGARQELRYLESLNKWSEMQKAVEDSQKLISDPDVDKPNAKGLSQAYLDSVQHRNLNGWSRAINSLINNFSEYTGVGPTILKGMNNRVKGLALMKFVGLFKLSHSLVTLLQPFQSIPNLNNLLRSRGAEIGLRSATAAAKAAHSLLDLSMNQNQFHKDAIKYMNANGTLDVNMSKHLDNVTGASGKYEWFMHNVGEANVRIPEYGARKFTFMYYANMMKDMGLPNSEIFPTAHNMMRYAMVDYAPHERPMMFGKMGLMGDIASTLTRFKYNQISQHMVGYKGGPLALGTVLATSIMAGGIRGVIGYEAANQLTKLISGWLADGGVIDTPTSIDEMFMHALLHVHNQNAKDLLNYGVPSTLGGIDMTGSLTNADALPTDPLGAMVPYGTELTRIGRDAIQFARQPNTWNAKRFAYQMAPNSMKGIMENELFTDDNGKFYNPNNPKGELINTRTPTDEAKRAFSFRPLEESKMKQAASVGAQEQEALKTTRANILNRSQAAMNSKDMSGSMPDRADNAEYIRQYLATGGDPRSLINDQAALLGKGKHLDQLQREAGIPTGASIQEVNRYKQFQDLAKANGSKK